MEIEYLREFATVAELGSFSRAAEELCISQSSLSKHILTLERELGTPLLIRNSRNVMPTPTGMEILPRAQKIQQLGLEIHAIATQQMQREKAILRIVSIPVMAQYNITGMLAQFRRSFPDVILEVQECEQSEIRGVLEQGQCELAFCRKDITQEDDTRMEFLPFCQDELIAVVSKDDPLAQQDHISLSDLRDAPLLFLDQQTGFHHLYISLCRSAGFVPNVAYTGRRPENIIDLAAQGMGVALLMRRHADYAGLNQVVCLDIYPQVESTVCLARLDSRSSTPLARQFWDFITVNRSI